MIYSFSSFGYEGSLVSVEVDLRRGIPSVDIVGISDAEVKPLRERILAAFRNTGASFPSERVLISLSPADLRKDGTAFDLPTALAVWKENAPTAENLDEDTIANLSNHVLVMGELELSGKVRPVRSIYPALSTAVSAGIQYAIIPEDSETAIPDGIKVAKVSSLNDAIEAMINIGSEEYFKYSATNNTSDEIQFEEFDEDYEKHNLDSIQGMNGLKYAMAIAVAGRHNIIAYGRPGCGKTLVLQRMPELMPKLLKDETPTVTRLQSLAGLLRPNEGFVTHRHFRMPHQTASIEGICGGGVHCRPGEISLAHNGVLFLDEAAEFRTSVLQMLRVPLETKSITLSRAGRSTVYPARFQLVMATNPCPCGNYGSKEKICLCSMKSVEQYWRKFSAPLLDRVSIRVDCNSDDTFSKYTREELRSLIKNAWEVQLKRQNKLNEDLAPEEVKKFIVFDSYAEKHLNKYAMERDLSGRTVIGLMKLARTVQDSVDGAEEVSDVSLSIALSLHKSTYLDSL